MNFEGLKDDVISMIAGNTVPVNTGSFANDMSTFHTEKEYCRSLEEYEGNILLVGVNYDKQTKEHECVIEEYVK